MASIEVKDISLSYTVSVKKEGRNRINRFTNLGERKQNKLILDRLSFQAKKGDIVGLTSNPGSGLTSLMKVIASSIKPDSGSAIINGKIHKLGLDTISFDNCTISQNIRLNGYKYYKSSAEIKGYISNFKTMFQKDYSEVPLNTDVSHLSYEMKRKITQFMSLARQPYGNVLLFDDWHFDNMHQEIEPFIDYADIVVIAVKDKKLITRYCNKAYQLKDGKLIEDKDLLNYIEKN